MLLVWQDREWFWADTLPVKRHLLRAAGLAACGAVLNIAVAWTCAATMDLGHGTVSELYAEVGTEHSWEVYRWDNVAGTRIMSRCWRGFAPGPYNHGDPATLLATWGRIVAPSEPLPASRSGVDEGWGLPMRSVGCYYDLLWTDQGEKSTSKAGVLRLRKSAGPGQRGLYLPVKPLWSGFVINTIVYALVVVAIHGVVRDIARAIRRRRAPAVAEPAA